MMRVVVGLSGGVDSAVAALLLKRAGHDVTGVFMKNWEEKDENAICTAEQDWKDVQALCDVIGIPYYSVNFAKEYYDRVFLRFLEEYQAGRTPNPDVLCNKEIKFDAFLNFAAQIGAEKMATGHFVQTNDQGDLLRGADAAKDQSYFLYMLKRAQLQKSLFPVGHLTKKEVRGIARQANIPVFDKKDSTGICFIGERHFKDFLAGFLPAQPGQIISVDGEILGWHDGLMYYTLGQRRGLGIGGHGDGRSWFVVNKELERNVLIVAQGEDHPMLFSTHAQIEQITWIGDPPGAQGSEIALTAKFRYRQPDQDVLLTYRGERGTVLFIRPQRAVTPGQSAVFYQGEVCLGGGIITSAQVPQKASPKREAVRL